MQYDLIIEVIKKLIRFDETYNKEYSTFEEAVVDIKKIMLSKKIAFINVVNEEYFDDLHIFNLNTNRILNIYT